MDDVDRVTFPERTHRLKYKFIGTLRLFSKHELFPCPVYVAPQAQTMDQLTCVTA